MAQYYRLCTGDPMMRSAMAMIELIFAIVIIAISILSIPSMMAVAGKTSKSATIDDDVMSRLSGWVLDKSQGRWDGRYAASNSGPLWLNNQSDLNCSRGFENVWFRSNPDSTLQCNDQNLTPSTIPTVMGNGVGEADGNTSKGLEMLNNGEETLRIAAVDSGATSVYDINATYRVSYVSSDISAISNGVASGVWQLGSSQNMSPSPAVNATHLKRVVTRFRNPDALNDSTDMVLTFFKSNKGN